MGFLDSDQLYVMKIGDELKFVAESDAELELKISWKVVR